jgi:hypothetical protein
MQTASQIRQSYQILPNLSYFCVYICPMIIYNVTINIDDDVREEWLDWMRKVHIPEVLQTGQFTSHRIVKVLTNDESGGTNYSIQYFCKSMADYEHYRDRYAPALQQAVMDRYKDKFVAFRTLLEVIE